MIGTRYSFVDEAAEYQSAEDLQAATLDAIESSPNDFAFIYAPWGYLTTTTMKALEDASSDAKVYGADSTDESILTMTTPNSIPWLAKAPCHFLVRLVVPNGNVCLPVALLIES
jgi:hypothetical protein